ncbi:protein phosphatase 2C domain-containing protein [Streptomyces sp. MST-110588]|nr:protein phosphatase 2C domain-containing protein [Streptomyces sp. MST-110588]
MEAPPLDPGPPEPGPGPRAEPRPDPAPAPRPCPDPAPAPRPGPVPETAPASAPDPVSYRPAPGFTPSRPATVAVVAPAALAAADPAAPDDLVPDCELEGAQYGTWALRAVSVRGAAARKHGRARADALLTARFGTGRQALVLVAVATGSAGSTGSTGGTGNTRDTGNTGDTGDTAPRAARDVCRWIAGAVGRSRARLAEDVLAGNSDALKSGLRRLTDRGFGRLRARAGELGTDPERYTAALRCLLLPADPDCRTRVFFGAGRGGLFRLRDGVRQDLEPDPAQDDSVGGPAAGSGAGLSVPPGQSGPLLVPGLLPPPGVPQDPYAYAEQWPPAPAAAPRAGPGPFLFRACVARPGDTLLLCSAGLAEPLSREPDFAGRLARRWAVAAPPELADFLADAQLPAEGYARDRTAVAVWEAYAAGQWAPEER